MNLSLPASRRSESLFLTAQRQAARHPHATGFVFHTAWHFADFQPTPEVDNTTTTANTTTTTAVTGCSPGMAPGALYTLLHNRRTAIGADQPKALVRAHPLVAVSWHGVTATHQGAQGAWLNIVVPPAPDTAYVHHYRGRCVDKFLRADCDVMLRRSYVDAIVPHYGDRLRARVARVCSTL